MSPRGLVAFDLDGTIVKIWSAWSWIHQLLGTKDKAKPYADQYHAGKIDYAQWAELDVELWHGVPLTHIEKAIQQRLEFIPNAKKLIETLHSYDLKTAIISSGLTVFANRATEVLGIDLSRANQLLTDEEGRICGVKVQVAYDNKHQVLNELAQKVGVSLAQSTAIGDSQNDIPMFQVAGFSIAFNPTNEKVGTAATTIVRSENAKDLLVPIQQFYQLDSP